MSPVGYCIMFRAKSKGSFVFAARMGMVRSALEGGIKATARLYQVSRNTVRLWLRRYQASGVAGMVDKSHAPHRCPHQIPSALEARIVALKQARPSWGSQRLKDDFGLACGHGAIYRVYRQHKLVRRRRKKKQRRRDLAAVKAQYRAFQRVCIDTKHLYDIPEYWVQMEQYHLPRYQWTARDMKSGTMFLGYARELSLSHSVVFALVLAQWLAKHGVSLAGTTWQSDGGPEFTGSWQAKHKSAFIKAVESFQVEYFQTSRITDNADVETVHNTIESELFEIEQFADRARFFAMTSSYLHYYNLLRKNMHKNRMSPLEILQQADRRINPAVLTMSALDLDRLLEYYVDAQSQGGQYQPGESQISRSSY